MTNDTNITPSDWFEQVSSSAKQAAMDHCCRADDPDTLNEDTLYENVHPGAFAEALERFDAIEAKDLSEAVAEGIALAWTDWMTPSEPQLPRNAPRGWR